MLYFTLARRQLPQARNSVVWNSITPTEANKPEGIQQIFSPLFKLLLFPRPLPLLLCRRAVKLKTLGQRRFSLEALFSFQVHLILNYVLFIETAVRRDPAGYSRDLALFDGYVSSRNCLSGRMTFGFLWRFWKRRCIFNPNRSSC
jgi:hypothetical protein